MNSLLKYIAKLFSKDSGASFGRVMSFILMIGALTLSSYAIFTRQIPIEMWAWALYALPYISSFGFYIITKWADLKLTDILNNVINKESGKK